MNINICLLLLLLVLDISIYFHGHKNTLNMLFKGSIIFYFWMTHNLLNDFRPGFIKYV